MRWFVYNDKTWSELELTMFSQLICAGLSEILINLTFRSNFWSVFALKARQAISGRTERSANSHCHILHACTHVLAHTPKEFETLSSMLLSILTSKYSGIWASSSIYPLPREKSFHSDFAYNPIGPPMMLKRRPGDHLNLDEEGLAGLVHDPPVKSLPKVGEKRLTGFL